MPEPSGAPYVAPWVVADMEAEIRRLRAEVLLDSEGRFSNRAGTCYEALATALQMADVPIPPKEAPEPPPAKSRYPTNAL